MLTCVSLREVAYWLSLKFKVHVPSMVQYLTAKYYVVSIVCACVRCELIYEGNGLPFDGHFDLELILLSAVNLFHKAHEKGFLLFIVPVYNGSIHGSVEQSSHCAHFTVFNRKLMRPYSLSFYLCLSLFMSIPLSFFYLIFLVSFC